MQPTISDKERNLSSNQRARRRIDPERLVEKLNKHIFGHTKLPKSKFDSIKLLLGKSLPDLQAMEMSVTGELSIVRSEPIKGSEWVSKFGVPDDAEDGQIETPQRSVSLEPGSWWNVDSGALSLPSPQNEPDDGLSTAPSGHSTENPSNDAGSDLT